jgi:hypothetical protein
MAGNVRQLQRLALTVMNENRLMDGVVVMGINL